MYGNTVIIRIVDREEASHWFASFSVHAIIYILSVVIQENILYNNYKNY